jgi:hypothetical protein
MARKASGLKETLGMVVAPPREDVKVDTAKNPRGRSVVYLHTMACRLSFFFLAHNGTGWWSEQPRPAALKDALLVLVRP